MPAVLASLLIGALFGVGLTISRMIDPAKVIGFLDFAGDWDPTLAFVMAAALAVSAIGYRLARGRGEALLGGPLRIPERGAVDAPLILGAVLFGFGWGLAGFCPGPAIAALATGLWPVWAFVAAMAAGMWLQGLLAGRVKERP